MHSFIRRIQRIFRAERLYRFRLATRKSRNRVQTDTPKPESASRIDLFDASFTDDVLSSHFQTLELPPESSLEEVKAAYHRLMQKYHPDHHQASQNKQETANEVARRLTESYKILRTYLEKSEKKEPVTSSD